MKVLVTGSTGFLGSWLCRALVEKGYEVRAFHRQSSSQVLIADLPVEHAVGDLTDKPSIEKAVDGVEAVFHAAALMGTSNDPDQLYRVTVEGSRLLLEAALDKGIGRFIHTSSVAALGVPPVGSENNSHIMMDENHTWNYVPEKWAYGYAKYLAELEIQKAAARGLDTVILNPSIVIGSGDIHRKTSSPIVMVANGGIPGLVNGGANLVHVRDVAEGHVAALERGKTGQRYILGGQNLTLESMLKLFADVAGVKVPSVHLPDSMIRLVGKMLPLVRNFVNLPIEHDLFHQVGRYFYYDNSKSMGELGIRKYRPLREAVQEAYDWFVENGAILKS